MFTLLPYIEYVSFQRNELGVYKYVKFLVLMCIIWYLLFFAKQVRFLN